jgi:conjugative relaxase-like TrwC/TraI family protein
MSDGAGYAQNHLEANDYYSENEKVAGQWFGRGAERLGLSGEVTHDAFELMRQCHDPLTGEMLRQRQSADRLDENGQVIAKGRSLYDFTFSAPKSVSIMAILGGDERLIEAHQRAVTEALTELERISATRVRTDGKNEDRVTGNMVVARYEHDASRRLDPQLHSHCVAGNLTYDEVEGRWKALQATDIYKSRAYLSEVYRNSLARQVTDLGYEIANRAPRRGRDMGFEIVGVPQEVIDRFSQGSKVREKSVEEFTKEVGRLPTDNEVAVMVADDRPEKLAELSTADVRRGQRERLAPEGQEQLNEVWSRAQENTNRPAPEFWSESSRSVQFAIDHTFARVSVSKDITVLTEALRHGRGKVGLEYLKTALDVQEATGNVFRDGKELATKESLDREREMIATIDYGANRFGKLGELESLNRPLNEGQREVLQAALDNRDFAFSIQGAAGAGKTQLLGELRHQLAHNKRPFTAVAPTNSAVEELHKVGYEDAMTIKALLDNKEHRAALKGSVLLIDEAGMVGSEPMHQLLRLARESGSRVVFSGDTSQIQPVEAGDALLVFEKHSRLQTKSLKEVLRQQEDFYREAVEKFRENPEWGFNRLLSMKAIHEVPYLERPRAVAEAYLKAGKDTLLICPTHEEIGRVTHEIRKLARDSGQLTDEKKCEHFVPENYSQAQKRDVSQLHVGQTLVFHKATKDVRKDEAVELIGHEKNAVIGRGEDGREIRITARQSKAFAVFHKEEIEVGAGDRLLLQANRRGELKFTNGEWVDVALVDSDGRKYLEDGRIMPANFKQFAYGHAVTAHASQGKTVSNVIVSADDMAKELFYVGISRGKFKCEVFTSDSERLQASVTESAARTSATELHMRVQAWQYAQRAQAHNDASNVQSQQQPAQTQTNAAPAPAPAQTAAPEVSLGR